MLLGFVCPILGITVIKKEYFHIKLVECPKTENSTSTFYQKN